MWGSGESEALYTTTQMTLPPKRGEEKGSGSSPKLQWKLEAKGVKKKGIMKTTTLIINLK
jgi:hypothetical protein